MHLDRVQLENFGIYHQHALELGQAKMILLYGPNESGKTTALNGLRQALFGFRTRTPYLISGRTMQADVRAQLANGEVLSFTRRKGRQDDVDGMLNGRAVDATAIAQLLGNLDLASYEQLFGFSLDELRFGEESLKSARLSEALAGGGLSGINALQKLRADLTSTLSDLYKARGMRSTINVKLQEIQETRTALSQVQVLPSEVEELQRQHQELIQLSQKLRDEQASTFENRAYTERLLEMLPNHRRLLLLTQQLAGIQLPDGIDMQFVANWSEHADKRQGLIKSLEQESNLLRQEQMTFDNLGGSSVLSEFEEAIERLGHQVEEISSLRKRSVDLQETFIDSRALCERLSETLQLTDTHDAIRDFVVTPPQRRELENMSRDASSVTEQQIAAIAKLEAARRSLAAMQPLDEDEQPPSNLDELAHLIKQLNVAETNYIRLSSLLSDLQQSATMLQLEHQLMSIGGTGLQLDWFVPSPEIVQQAAERRTSMVSRCKQLEHEIASIESEIQIVENQLDDVDQTSIERILGELSDNRRQRELLLDHWEDDLTQPLIAGSITAAVQSERLSNLRELAKQSDQLQQSLIELAEAVAVFQASQKQILRMREVQSNLHLQKTEATEQLQQWSLDWSALWQPMTITPQSPEKMLQWLADFDRWREHQQRIAIARRELHIAGGVVRQLRNALMDQWPSSLREDTAVEVLSSRLMAWQNAERDAARDAQRLRTAKAEFDALNDEVHQLADRREAIEQRYQRWLATVPVKQPWGIDQVVQLIDSIEHFRREDETARKAEAELASIASRLESFDSEARRVARLMQSELPATVPCDAAVRGWFDEIKVMREQRSERIRLKTSIEYRNLRVAELSQERLALDERLAALCAASGSADAVGVTSIAELVQRAEQLRQEIAECQSVLEGQAAGQPVEVLLAQLASQDEAGLRFAIEEFSRQLDALDQQRKLTDQKIGSLNQRIEQMAQSEHAGKLAQTLHHQRSQLSELCEQWVVHRLAAELLDRAVERFSSEHEPILLQYTRDFLQQLTGGRYQSVEHDANQPTKFIVRNSKGESFEPERLSTGTREQLYLAIRMAFITNYCNHHEPLPVIMDDCFVNFDDARTAYALRAISQWSTGAQRILLSCHYRVVQSLAEIAPDTPCIHLQRNERTTVGELASETLVQ